MIFAAKPIKKLYMDWTYVRMKRMNTNNYLLALADKHLLTNWLNTNFTVSQFNRHKCSGACVVDEAHTSETLINISSPLELFSEVFPFMDEHCQVVLWDAVPDLTSGI